MSMSIDLFLLVVGVFSAGWGAHALVTWARKSDAVKPVEGRSISMAKPMGER
ncbi:MAG: hypothetical protein HPY85_06690 [Anaerolineae bacterium]|nr:hypothetical protein [Anaerolineae bacterium]